MTHRGPIGATWPDSVTHPRVVARVPSGAAWVPAMKVGTPRLRARRRRRRRRRVPAFDGGNSI